MYLQGLSHPVWSVTPCTLLSTLLPLRCETQVENQYKASKQNARQSLKCAVMKQLEDVLIYISWIAFRSLGWMDCGSRCLFPSKNSFSYSEVVRLMPPSLLRSLKFRAALTHLIQWGGSHVCANPTRMFQQICMPLLTDKRTLCCHRGLAVKCPAANAEPAEVWLNITFSLLAIYAAGVYLRLHIPAADNRFML